MKSSPGDTITHVKSSLACIGRLNSEYLIPNIITDDWRVIYYLGIFFNTESPHEFVIRAVSSLYLVIYV